MSRREDLSFWCILSQVSKLCFTMSLILADSVLKIFQGKFSLSLTQHGIWFEQGNFERMGHNTSFDKSQKKKSWIKWKILGQKPAGALHQKPYYACPWISWKVKKYQTNIIFSSNFWIKNTVFPISEKFNTRNFQQSVNMVFHAKENIISTFWIKTKLYYPSP